jgi:hypothetical protein
LRKIGPTDAVAGRLNKGLKGEENDAVKMPTWLSWKSGKTKSEDLKKVRQRTDQMIQRQEVLKQLQEDGQEN